MVEIIIAAILGLSAGIVATYKKPEPTQTVYMQCSVACGKDRMIEYTSTHGTCKCRSYE